MPRKITVELPDALADAIDAVGTSTSDFLYPAHEHGRRTRSVKIATVIRHALANPPERVTDTETEPPTPAPMPEAAPTLTPARITNRYLSDDEVANHATIVQDAFTRKHIADMDTAALLNLLLSEHSVPPIHDLRHLASLPPQTISDRLDVPIWTANRIALAFEFGKRLANAHSKRDKITSPADVADLLMSKMRYLTHEVVVTLALDTKGGVMDALLIAEDEEIATSTVQGSIIGNRVIFEGTLNASVFHPREIFRYAIENAANSIVLVHNHPSGCPQPSMEDIRATKQLIEAGNQIGIKVLDHIIIGDGTFISLKEENHI